MQHAACSQDQNPPLPVGSFDGSVRNADHSHSLARSHTHAGRPKCACEREGGRGLQTEIRLVQPERTASSFASELSVHLLHKSYSFSCFCHHRLLLTGTLSEDCCATGVHRGAQMLKTVAFW